MIKFIFSLRQLFINENFCTALWVTTMLIYASVTAFMHKAYFWVHILFHFEHVINCFIMFYTVYGNPFASAQSRFSSLREDMGGGISVMPRNNADIPLRLEALLILEELCEDEWVDIIPLILDFTFYPDQRFWLRFPGMIAFCVVSDVLNRNIYLQEYVISDQNDINKLEIALKYRYEPVLRNHEDIMDAVMEQHRKHGERIDENKIKIYLSQV